MEREKLRIPQVVLVEGKYDKIRLSGILDAEILTTDGFGIFNKNEKLSLLRALAARHGIIVLTDSDGAGTLIRSHITSALPREQVYHLYIPQIAGKERRKSAPSKAGTLGVEGMDNALLRELFLPFAAEGGVTRGGITKTDFYLLGLSGTPDCAARRDAAALHYGLPRGMTANALLGALNLLCDADSLRETVAQLFPDGGDLREKESDI